MRLKKKLVQIRGEPGGANALFSYDQENDIQRKIQYEKLYARTPQELEEEEFLMEEKKKISKQNKKNPKDLKRPLPHSEPVPQSPISQNSNNPPESPDPEPPKQNKRRKGKKIEVEQPPIIKETIPKKREKAGTFVRSSNALSPLQVNTKTARKVDEVLLEIGVGLRPTVNTGEIVKAFNNLRQDIVLFVDLQNSVNEKEQILQILREQKERIIEQRSKSKT